MGIEVVKSEHMHHFPLEGVLFREEKRNFSFCSLSCLFLSEFISDLMVLETQV